MKLSEAQSFNAIAWIINNQIRNENASPVEFRDHRFLIAPYLDNTPEQSIKKAGQVGWSTLAILRSFHMAKYLGANIIYTLPSRNSVKDFVTPKVDPLIEHNPAIKLMIGQTDSTQLKSVGGRFIYFRGSWEPSQAISISAHILINDELDRSNPLSIKTFRTRLDDAKRERPDLGWQWQFSNPSTPGYGVDELWQKSDMKHWMIKCSRCNEWQAMDFPDNIDFEKKVYICASCKRELSHEDRVKGHWVKKRLGSDISGYWINQLMCSWHSAAKIIKDSEGDPGVFHNFTLGKAYVSKDAGVTRSDLIKCLVPGYNPRTNVAIGVDNGIVKTVVIGNKYGIFRALETEDWREIEDLRNQYSAYMVIDANPYPNEPRKLAKKYRGKVFMHYYKEDEKQMGVVRWGEDTRETEKYGVVYSDRTKIIDETVADIMTQDQVFNLTEKDLEQYIFHWQQMYRTIVTNERGIQKPVWLTHEGKPDHFAHATVLMKIALLKTMSQGAVITSPPPQKQELHPRISGGMKAPDLDELARKLTRPAPRNWKNT